MLAICCLCATLSRQELLVSMHDENHECILQLMHCFKFKINVKQFVCPECIKMVQLCDDFFKKIEKAQDSLNILFKAKSDSNAEKSAKLNQGIIRTRDFCRIRVWENEKVPQTSEKEKENDAFEEPSCSKSNENNVSDIKVEIEEPNDPLTVSTNQVNDSPPLQNAFNDTTDKSIESTKDTELPMNSVFSEGNETTDENFESTSDESPFMGFEQVAIQSNTRTNVSGKIKIAIIKYQCAKCSCSFPSEQLLQRHLQEHSKTLAIKCKECNKIFRHSSALKIHMRSHDSETKSMYQCKSCLKTFRLASSLWSHTKIHTEGRFKCDFCSKAFFRQENLKDHLDEHSCNRTFNCEMCKKAFHSQRKLTRHIDDHHVASVWKCKECPSTFSTLAALNSHMQRFTHIQHTCKICKRNFRSEVWYKSHLRTHSIAALAKEQGSAVPIILEASKNCKMHQ